MVVILFLIATVVFIGYLAISPEGAPPLRCPFKMMTGLDCPGCGSQRACQALINGNFSAAWGYNPATIVGLPLILFFGVVEMWRERWPRFHDRATSKWVILSLFFSIIGWWIGRNLF